VKKAIEEDALSRKLGVVNESDNDQLVYSSITLALWDFSLASASEAKEQSANCVGLYKALKSAETRKERIFNRTRNERILLFIRRLSGFVLVCSLIAGSWAAIIYLTIQQTSVTNELVSLTNENNVFAVLLGFVVPVTINLIGFITPLLISVITDFEKWDEPEFQVQIATIRLYIVNVLNIIIVVFTYIVLLLDISLPFTLISEDSSTPCSEDRAGEALFLMVLTDFFADKILSLLSIFATRLLARIRYAGLACFFSTNRRRAAVIYLDVSDNFVSLILSETLMLVTMVFYPFVSWLACFLTYLSFKWEYFLLVKFTRQSHKSGAGKKTGVFFMHFALATCCLVAAVVYVFLLLTVHQCGAHNGMTGAFPIFTYIASVPAATIVFDVISNGWILWGIIIIVLGQLLFQINERDAILQVLQDRKRRTVADATTYRRLVKKLRMKISELEEQERTLAQT